MAGRPLELNEDVAEAICSRVEAGRPIPLAAESAGFSAAAVWKWQRQGKADLRNGVDSMQARFVQRLARARDGLAARLQGYVIAGIESPKDIDGRTAISALKTFLPRYFGDRALDAQAAREEQADAPADAATSPTQGPVVEAVRCVTCGVGTASDDPGRPPLFCAGCGAKLPAASTAR